MNKTHVMIFSILFFAVVFGYALLGRISPSSGILEGDTQKNLPEITIVMQEGQGKYTILWSLENNLTKLPEGVNIIVADVDKANNLLISGNADMGFMSTASYAAISDKKNTTLKIISTGTTQSEAGIFTYRGSNITLNNLGSVKTILTPPASSTNFILFKGVLKDKFNITFNPDKVIFISKPVSVVPKLLENKDADIGVISNIVYFDALNNPKLELLYNYADGFNDLYGHNAISTVVVADERVLSDPRIKDIMSVLKESWVIGSNNIDKVDKWVFDVYGLNYSAEFRYNKDKVQFEPLNEKTVGAIRQIWLYGKDAGVVENVPDIDSAIAKID